MKGFHVQARGFGFLLNAREPIIIAILVIFKLPLTSDCEKTPHS